MCLAIPAQIVEIKQDNRASVSIGGVIKEISLSLLDEAVVMGDFVIMHVGFALAKLDEVQAQKTLADFAKMLEEK
ncbi:MAG: HypC/HybG/HupF family hydrogenase formation chaperone [Francisellaceae bacterium]